VIPLPQIISEIVMGLGAALVIGTLLAMFKPKFGPDGRQVVTAKGRAIVNVLIGLLVFAWGLASFVTKNGV
jgi:hypothetical protein